MVAGAHHIRERQQGRHQRVIGSDRKANECSVGERHAHRFALSAIQLAAPEAAVQARSLEALLTELARSIGPGERRDDEIALLHCAHVTAGVFDNTDELVTHAPSAGCRFHLLIRPEVTSADAGACHADNRIRWLDNAGIGDILDADIARAVHDGCSHKVFISC